MSAQRPRTRNEHAVLRTRPDSEPALERVKAIEKAPALPATPLGELGQRDGSRNAVLVADGSRHGITERFLAAVNEALPRRALELHGRGPDPLEAGERRFEMHAALARNGSDERRRHDARECRRTRRFAHLLEHRVREQRGDLIATQA